MAKPICLVKIAPEFLNQNKALKYDVIIKALTGYNVLFIRGKESQEEMFELQVFYHKDYIPAQYEELKKIVQESIKQ